MWKKRIKKNCFAHENMKKPPQKEISFLCPTAQMAEFMFPNVALEQLFIELGLQPCELCTKRPYFKWKKQKYLNYGHSITPKLAIL